MKIKRRLSMTVNNRGFTLVEIIVVLVILAILAAFTIPAMLGFVENAKAKANIPRAREVYTAGQSALTAAFGLCVNYDLSNSGPENQRIAFKRVIAEKFIEYAGNDLGITNHWLPDENESAADNCVEVAFKYSEYYNTSSGTAISKDKIYVIHKNAAKIWVDRGNKDNSTDGKSDNKYTVKAIWYTSEDGNYLIEINDGSTNIYKKVNNKWSKL